MKIKNRIKSILSNYKFIVLLFLLFAMAASFQSLILGLKPPEDSRVKYCISYNNHEIFKNSFHHLIDGKDLYMAEPFKYWDIYKYSPSFAAFF